VSAARHHQTLTPERWSSFPFDQQILMVGNEMNRTWALLEAGQWDRARLGYERVLELIDLTIAGATGSRRRELLRWRDLAAALYLESRPDMTAHRLAFRCLLQLTPASFRQIELLPGTA
jgi:hypothetical protein